MVHFRLNQVYKFTVVVGAKSVRKKNDALSVSFEANVKATGIELNDPTKKFQDFN